MAAWGQSATPATQQTNGRTPSYASSAQPSAPKFRGCSKITDYDILRKLGEGTFGEVLQAKHKITGSVVAVKKILMHNEKDGFPITALREIKLLKLLKHVNVLTLEEMAIEHPAKTTSQTRKRATMYMVTPYMDHDLSGLLDNRNVPFGVPQVKCYMLQLLQGLAYIHGQNILHRDIKAANLLINNKGILQIADFGLARHYEGDVPKPGVSPVAVRDYTALVVTRWYRPPELLMHLRRYTPAIDVWGVGCVFGEMLERKPILAGESDAKQLQMIFQLVGNPTDESMPGWKLLPGGESLDIKTITPALPTRFKGHAPGTVQLLADLLKLDWTKRLNAIDAIEHQYFKESPPAARPGDLPHYEESHELDKRANHPGRRGLPPAPRGYAVGESKTNSTDSWGQSTSRPPPPPPPPPPPHQNGAGPHLNGNGWGNRGGYRNENGHRGPPADRPRHTIYNRPYREPGHGAGATWGGDSAGGGGHSDRPHDEYRGGRDRGRDTYVPSYGGDGRRDDWRRDGPDYDRRERPAYRDRLEPRLDYDERRGGLGTRGGGWSNGRATKSRSRSPMDRERARTRERDSPDRTNVYRR